MKQYLLWFAAVGLGATLAACEPDSVADARDQLGRGGSRDLAFTIPVRNDTLTVGDVLEDFVGLSVGDLDGIASVALDAESLDVAVGDRLDFDNLTLTADFYSFDQMLQTSETSTAVSLTLSGPGPSPTGPFRAAAANGDTVRFTTPDGSAVTSATVDTGTVTRTLTNSTFCEATVSMELVDVDGDVVLAFPDRVVAAGATAEDTLAADAATVDEFLEVRLDATPEAGCTPNAGESVDADLTFHPMTLVSVTLSNVQENFTEQYDFLASEPRVTSVDTIGVAAGTFTLDVTNKLPVTLDVDFVLNGVLDAAGTPLTGSLRVPAAPGDGSTTSASVGIDLAGTTVVTATALAALTATATASSATITPALATNAIGVDGGGSLDVNLLAGALDPVETPELNIALDETREIPRDNLDLGEFEDVVRDATLNTVSIGLSVRNDADVPVTLSDFRIGAVRIDPATGDPERDVNGGLVFETDSLGNPIVVDTTLALVRAGTTTVTLADSVAAALVDRLVDLLIDSVRVAVAGSGTAVVGDGTQARITNADRVAVVFDIQVGLDFTLPATGVEFSSNTVNGGLDFDPADQDAVLDRLDSAGVRLRVENGTPFEVQATIAVVADSLDGDVFAEPGRVDIDPIAVDAAGVDADGRVQTPTTSEVAIRLSGQEVRVFLGTQFTAGIRVRILPPAGQRGALRTADRIIVRASAQIWVRTGGGQ